MLKIEVEREEDGRWIADVPALPGVLAYGTTEAEARARTISLASDRGPNRQWRAASRRSEQSLRGVKSWQATETRRVSRALRRIGWTLKRQTGSHRILTREGWGDYVFGFHDSEKIGLRMLARISKHTGLSGPKTYEAARFAKNVAVPRGAAKGERYPAQAMATLDSEKRG